MQRGCVPVEPIQQYRAVPNAQRELIHTCRRPTRPDDALMATVHCGSIPSNTLAPHFVDA